MNILIGSYCIEFNRGSRRRYREGLLRFKSEGGITYIFGRLVLSITNVDLPIVATCAQCGSVDVGETRAEVTVCSDCCSVEGGYVYLTVREYEHL